MEPASTQRRICLYIRQQLREAVSLVTLLPSHLFTGSTGSSGYLCRNCTQDSFHARKMQRVRRHLSASPVKDRKELHHGRCCQPPASEFRPCVHTGFHWCLHDKEVESFLRTQHMPFRAMCLETSMWAVCQWARGSFWGIICFNLFPTNALFKNPPSYRFG